MLVSSLSISPTDGGQVDPGCTDFLRVLQPQLFHDQLGMPKVSLKLEASASPSHHAVEYLPLCCLILLGLDLVLLCQDNLHPVKVSRGARAAVIVAVD